MCVHEALNIMMLEELFAAKPGRVAPVPVAVETFHALQQRQMGEAAESGGNSGHGHRRPRVNLLNWDGSGAPAGLFPESNSEGSVER